MSLKFVPSLNHRAVIDITSLIDLVFLLVAFFLVSSSLDTEVSVSVNLPKAVQTGGKEYSSMAVTVNSRNEIYVDDVPVSRDGLLSVLKSRKDMLQNGNVVIRGDRDAKYELLVFVMDTLNQAGIARFSIAAEK